MAGEASRVEPRERAMRLVRRGACVAAVGCMFALVAAAIGSAQTGPAEPKTLPETTIAPAPGPPPETAPAGDTEGPDISAPAAPEGAEPPPPAPAHPLMHHSHPMIPATYNGPLKPGKAMLKLKADDWAYSLPAKSSRHIERVQAGKFINVTGSTHYYLQVKLKSGATAYVPTSAVELARPTDKVFRLTKDAAVLSAPSHFGKKLAEVHNGHDVHVVGTSMNYLKIKMKDGLEGYVAMSALE